MLFPKMNINMKIYRIIYYFMDLAFNGADLIPIEIKNLSQQEILYS